MYRCGEITRFGQFKKWLPKTRLANDLGISVQRIQQLLTKNIGSLTVDELERVSEVLDIDFKCMCVLTINEYRHQRRKKPRFVLELQRVRQGSGVQRSAPSKN